MTGLEPQQLLILSLWLLLAAYISLFVRALRARVVVCFDWRDLAWTLSPAAFLLLALVVSRSLLPAAGDADGSAAPADSVCDGAQGCAALGLLVSLGYSICCNGLLVGLAVFAFKLVSLALAVLLAVLLWPAKRRLNPILLPLVAAGCLALLINGDRVLRRRALRHRITRDRALRLMPHEAARAL